MKFLFAITLVVLVLQSASVLSRSSRGSSSDGSTSSWGNSFDSGSNSGIKSSGFSSGPGGRPAISPPSNGPRPSGPITTHPVRQPSGPITTHPIREPSAPITTFGQPSSPIKTHGVTSRPQPLRRTTTTTRRSAFVRSPRCSKEPLKRFICRASQPKYFYTPSRGCYQGTGCGTDNKENFFGTLDQCKRLCVGH